MTVSYKFAQMCLAKQRREKKSPLGKGQDDSRSQQASVERQQTLENSTGFTEALVNAHKADEKKAKDESTKIECADPVPNKDNSVQPSAAESKIQEHVKEKADDKAFEKVENLTEESETNDQAKAEELTTESSDSDSDQDGSSDSESSSGSGSSSDSTSESGSESGTGSQSESDSDSSDSEEDKQNDETMSTAEETKTKVNELKESSATLIHATIIDKCAENKDVPTISIEAQKSEELCQNRIDNKIKAVTHENNVRLSGTSSDEINSTKKFTVKEVINGTADKVENEFTNLEMGKCINGTIDKIEIQNEDAVVKTNPCTESKNNENVDSRNDVISEDVKIENVEVHNTETEETQSESEDSSSENESDSDDESTTQNDDGDNSGSESDSNESTEENSDEESSESSESSNEGESAVQNEEGKAKGSEQTEEEETGNENHGENTVSENQYPDKTIVQAKTKLNAAQITEQDKEHSDVKNTNKSKGLCAENNVHCTTEVNDGHGESQTSLAKSGSAESECSELSLSEFVTLDALEDDFLFSNEDENSFTVDEKKKGTKSGNSSASTCSPRRSSPRKRPSQKCYNVNFDFKASDAKLSRDKCHRSRSPSELCRSRNDLVRESKSSNDKYDNGATDKLKQSTPKCASKACIKESKTAENSMENVDNSTTSLEEGEIEESFNSSSEVRRSPRKHPSSHNSGDRWFCIDSPSSRGSVKRRLASPPSRTKRARLSPARKHNPPRSSRPKVNNLPREGSTSSRSALHWCRDKSNQNLDRSYDSRDRGGRHHARSNSDTKNDERREKNRLRNRKRRWSRRKSKLKRIKQEKKEEKIKQKKQRKEEREKSIEHKKKIKEERKNDQRKEKK